MARTTTVPRTARRTALALAGLAALAGAAPGLLVPGARAAEHQRPASSLTVGAGPRAHARGLLMNETMNETINGTMNMTDHDHDHDRRLLGLEDLLLVEVRDAPSQVARPAGRARARHWAFGGLARGLASHWATPVAPQLQDSPAPPPRPPASLPRGRARAGRVGRPRPADRSRDATWRRSSCRETDPTAR